MCILGLAQFKKVLLFFFSKRLVELSNIFDRGRDESREHAICSFNSISWALSLVLH